VKEQNSSSPKLLLLVGASPSERHGGEVYLRELCRRYPAGHLSRFSIVHSQYECPKMWLNLPLGYASYPKDHVRRLGFPLAQITAYCLNLYNRIVKVPALVARIVQFAQQQRTQFIWAILDGPILIYVARSVAKALSVPLVVSVLDPLERWEVDLRLDPFTRSQLNKEFASTVREAVGVAVISEGMKAQYKTRYGVDSVIIRHGITREGKRVPSYQRRRKDEFIIGFCGSPYASREMRALVSALSAVEWNVDGVNLILRVVCDRAHWALAKGQNIQYVNWRSLEEAVGLMADGDITYLPYWFDKRYQPSVRLCFPTKLTTYLAAGRPVFYHGPRESSVTEFFCRFPAGTCCHSLEKSQVLTSLRRLVHDHDYYASAVRAGQRALEEELNDKVSLFRFASLIGIEESALSSS